MDFHVIPALIHKLHQAKVTDAKVVTLWGTGSPRREFLQIDDLGDACLFLMEHYESGEIINIGVGEDLTILELASLVAEVVGFTGRLSFDSAFPDGTPRKLLDISRITQMGWRARTPLKDGLTKTYAWFCQSHWANNK